MVTFCPSERHCASAADAICSAASVESVASLTTDGAVAEPASASDAITIPVAFIIPSSIELGAAFLDELGPLREIGGHELAEFRRAVADRLRAVGDDALAHVGLREHAQQRLVQPRDDVARQAGGADDAGPADEVGTGPRFRPPGYGPQAGGRLRRPDGKRGPPAP